MKTRVVNITRHKGDYVYIGRPSIFGNPFLIPKDGNREEVIEKYREWFERRLGDAVFKAAVLKLKGKALGCYCAPDDCHGRIIKEFLEGEGLFVYVEGE